MTSMTIRGGGCTGQGGGRGPVQLSSRSSSRPAHSPAQPAALDSGHPR